MLGLVNDSADLREQALDVGSVVHAPRFARHLLWWAPWDSNPQPAD